TNAGAPNLVRSVPVMNCYDGWYSLDALNVNVLAQIGLDPTEFGVTAWGGTIEYCRDYEPSPEAGYTANDAPHYAALRFNQNLSKALAPTNNASQNVIVTF